MRILHILIFNSEPLVTAWWGPMVADEEGRWKETPSDKIFTAIESFGYLVIWIVLLNL